MVSGFSERIRLNLLSSSVLVDVRWRHGSTVMRWNEIFDLYLVLVLPMIWLPRCWGFESRLEVSQTSLGTKGLITLQDFRGIGISPQAKTPVDVHPQPSLSEEKQMAETPGVAWPERERETKKKQSETKRFANTTAK